ncbi:hypothetical protein EMIHUDRAFT_202124 [Emiliania huxleyi CCMP1516]|uniref:Inosine/uridine-preferring nucleoside hydrolase domain-containing protein n=2 Tax=Emiliania huxleyi TaxID=2903 RepID=A0A0D3KF26_EMIH1|nr:hypothetical protein EMIHUDRAFT_202124 [Emiliania huxleyi CCMP1516]EOD34361.1 hypothetical protein EMIHUDRAFT_202124 [Emiliania huxleyi CCMP1516]|eukprot:XP_005786790.1 hypothetical protein EMIHUDRAFT_202124 [Emiliania huxleyi CCMP1516]
MLSRAGHKPPKNPKTHAVKGPLPFPPHCTSETQSHTMDAMSVGLLFGSVTFWNFGVLLWLLAAALPAASAAIADGSPSAQPVPVILDTVGTFMDDSFALAMLLRTPHLVLKLLVTASHDVVGRARVAAKHLSLVGCDAVPIGIGVPSDNGTGALFPWAAKQFFV